MRRCITLLILLTCKHVGAQEPAAAPPILVLDSGGHTSMVWKVLFTPDGKELVSVSDDKTVRFWDVASGEPIRVLRPPIGPGYEGKLYAAALSPGRPDPRRRRLRPEGCDRIDLPDLDGHGADRAGAQGAHERHSFARIRCSAGRPPPPGLGIR